MVRVFFIVLCVIALGSAGAYYFGAFSAGGGGAQLIFKAPDAIFYGVPFELSVGIGNNSVESWHDVSLSLSLPAGVAFADGAGSKSVGVKQLGILGEGSLTDVKFILIAVQVAPDEKDSALEDAVSVALSGVEARLTYALGKGTTVFEKNETWRAPVFAPAVTITLTLPETIKSGEEFKIKIDYANSADADMDGLSLHMQYPEGFVFEKATSDADAYDADWNIGALSRGSKDSITIFGHMKNVATSEFKAMVRRDTMGSPQSIAVARAMIAVEEPPLTVAIDINDSPDYVARLGETLTYTIAYAFDKEVQLKGGMTVRVLLASELFDFATVVVNDGGFLRPDSATGAPQIVWRVDHPDAEGGSVSFSVKVKNDYGIKRLSDRNFTLKLRAEAQAGTMVGSAEREIKVSGDMRVEARGYFRDAASGIVNSGVMPPLVGVPTEYTIHWMLKNYGTDSKNVVVRAKLQPGVRFTKAGKGTLDSKPAYDASSGEVVWKIDRMSATTGVLGAPPEAIFQIEAIPAKDAAGKPMPLITVTTVAALDDFTGVTLSGSAPEITTALPDDPTVAGQGDVHN